MAGHASTTIRCPNCARLERRTIELEPRVAQLEQLLEKATRTQKRQTAPFSKGTPKQAPKTPGRKPGDPHGPKAHRPLPEHQPGEIIDVPLPEQCPECGGLAVARARLEKRLDRLLEWNLSHHGNRRFQKHLTGRRDEILTFLYEPDIEATNWPAEQAVRPLVVNRKVFGGNRTPAGGHAQEILGSVFATLTKRALDTLSFLSRVICVPAGQRPRLIRQLLPIDAGILCKRGGSIHL